MKKPILFVVFAIPIIIALVLNIFGENTFSVPIYYETGVNSAKCGVNIRDQYRIKVLAGSSVLGRTSIVFFNSELNDHFSTMKVELMRILSTKVKNSHLQVLVISDENISAGNEGDFTTILVGRDSLQTIANCDLLISEQPIEDAYSVFVLIDREGRIRGYFEGEEMEQFDRISAEMDILELEYQKD